MFTVCIMTSSRRSWWLLAVKFLLLLLDCSFPYCENFVPLKHYAMWAKDVCIFLKELLMLLVGREKSFSFAYLGSNSVCFTILQNTLWNKFLHLFHYFLCNLLLLLWMEKYDWGILRLFLLCDIMDCKEKANKVLVRNKGTVKSYSQNLYIPSVLCTYIIVGWIF